MKLEACSNHRDVIWEHSGEIVYMKITDGIHTPGPLSKAMKISAAEVAVARVGLINVQNTSLESMVKSKGEVTREAQANNTNVHIATLNNGSVVIRGDKDDSGRCAVLTEHGVSASHITAAKVLDTMSRLPGMG